MVDLRRQPLRIRSTDHRHATGSTCRHHVISVGSLDCTPLRIRSLIPPPKPHLGRVLRPVRSCSLGGCLLRVLCLLAILVLPRCRLSAYRTPCIWYPLRTLPQLCRLHGQSCRSRHLSAHSRPPLASVPMRHVRGYVLSRAGDHHAAPRSPLFRRHRTARTHTVTCVRRAPLPVMDRLQCALKGQHAHSASSDVLPTSCLATSPRQYWTLTVSRCVLRVTRAS
ncbi:uncharacterized protein B0H18DRAFT_993581 [Fomitopsis serialis]|uniref:uncharacterized protein n=1 Tax=Fomitopsis serialis TaxID=139415 RepID=UPI002008D84D|nr:uncharacterized protein B0H18DRAFT_993581 [Neoantrodia serialis]KAH9930783.1 hypothetical protein B0H18DRAFT_993581 [Neoantrodia serialis]